MRRAAGRVRSAHWVRPRENSPRSPWQRPSRRIQAEGRLPGAPPSRMPVTPGATSPVTLDRRFRFDESSVGSVRPNSFATRAVDSPAPGFGTTGLSGAGGLPSHASYCDATTAPIRSLHPRRDRSRREALNSPVSAVRPLLEQLCGGLRRPGRRTGIQSFAQAPRCGSAVSS
jgi:hypothetical protein